MEMKITSMESYEDEKRGWNPIRIKVPHPSRVLMDPLEMSPEICIIEGIMYAKDIQELVESKAKYASKQVYQFQAKENPYEELGTVQLWTPQWHCMKLKAGPMLYTERNWFGFQPNAHAYAGWGMEQTGVQFNPSHLAVGMLEGVLEVIRMRAQQMSALHNAVLNRGYARLGTSRDSAEAADDLSKGTNAVLEGEKDDWWWLEYPELRDWVFKAGDELDRVFEAGTYARTLAGDRPEGVVTVGQHQILTSAAGKKFFAPHKQVERLTSLTMERILRMIWKRGESLIISGQKLSVGDIGGHFGVEARFKQQDPLLMSDQKRVDAEWHSQGLLSAETVRLNNGYENNAEEEKRLLKEEVKKRPDVHEYMSRQIMRSEGLSALADEFDVADRERKAAEMAAGQNVNPTREMPNAQP